jgi:hypothetical protein
MKKPPIRGALERLESGEIPAAQLKRTVLRS